MLNTYFLILRTLTRLTTNILLVQARTIHLWDYLNVFEFKEITRISVMVVLWKFRKRCNKITVQQNCMIITKYMQNSRLVDSKKKWRLTMVTIKEICTDKSVSERQQVFKLFLDGAIISFNCDNKLNVLYDVAQYLSFF